MIKASSGSGYKKNSRWYGTCCIFTLIEEGGFTGLEKYNFLRNKTFGPILIGKKAEKAAQEGSKTEEKFICG